MKNKKKPRSKDTFFKVARSQVFEVFVDNPGETGLMGRICASIDLYRAVSKKAFAAIAMAATAGGSIKITDESNLKVSHEKGLLGKTKEILALAFGVSGKAAGYELRDFIKQEEMPSVLSFVFDSCRSDVVRAWSHPDPEFSTKTKNISHGWLMLQGRRAFSRFDKVGIEMPRLSARPKLMEKSVIVKWDHSIGLVEFHVKLPGNMFWKYKNIRDGEWKPGTMRLGYRYKNGSNGQKHKQLILIMSYKMPEKVVEGIKDRVMHVEFTDDPENAIVMYCEDKFHYSDKIDVSEAIVWNKELSILTDKFKTQRSSVGSKFRRWGSNKILKVVNNRSENITKRKIEGKKYRNHLWTRKIVSRAFSWGCGHIIINNLPSGILCGMEWSIFEFEAILRYKVEDELKGVLTTIAEKLPEKVVDDVVIATTDDEKVAVQIETEVA